MSLMSLFNSCWVSIISCIFLLKLLNEVLNGTILGGAIPLTPAAPPATVLEADGPPTPGKPCGPWVPLVLVVPFDLEDLRSLWSSPSLCPLCTLWACPPSSFPLVSMAPSTSRSHISNSQIWGGVVHHHNHHLLLLLPLLVHIYHQVQLVLLPPHSQ